MAYDPAEVETRDWIRGLIGDTAATPRIADATYDSVIARYAITGYAVAEMALRMARLIEDRPTQIASTGDGSVGWGATRAKALYEIAARHQALADAEVAAGGAGVVIDVIAEYLTGPEVLHG